MTKEDIDQIVEEINRGGSLGGLFDKNDVSVEREFRGIIRKLQKVIDYKPKENRLSDKYAEILFQVVKNKIPEEYKDYFYMQMIKIGEYRIFKYIENDDEKIKYLDALPNDEARILVIKGMEDDNILMFLQQFDENGKILLIGGIKNPDKRAQAFGLLEGEYRDALKRMYQKNNDVLENIDARILKPRYLQTLGEDRINLISCYEYIQNIILDLDEKEYSIFVRCLDNYILQTQGDEDWTVIAETILENLKRGEYKELINNIEDIEKVDISKLLRILQLTNYFDIKVTDDIERFEEIKKKKCDEIINRGGNIEEKKKAVLLKLFGQDYSSVRNLLEKYGEDIESLEDCDEKYFIIALKEIMALEDEDILIQIYSECEEVGLIDKTLVERELKRSFGKKFNEGLYKIKEEDLIAEEDLPEELKGLNLNVYDAGTDFKMIITSVAPYSQEKPSDFKADWNQSTIASQYFCASYIRNDMLARADIPHLCYGFIEMKDDALVLEGNSDIDSVDISFVPRSKRERYYSPERLINESEWFNEIDFKRIQGGIKKQPDYIVAFRSEGKIDNIDKIIKASRDWGGKLPIVIIDEEKVFESENAKIRQALAEYNLSGDKEKAREIVQRVRNNNNSSGWFHIDEDLEMQVDVLRKELEEQQSIKGQNESKSAKGLKTKNELLEVHDGVTPKEREEGLNEIRKLCEKMQNITQKIQSEEINK